MKDEIVASDGLVLSKDFALYLSGEEVLAITDLHIGYEASLQAEAVAIPDFQFDVMLKRLGGLLGRYSPKTVLVNGDLKHEFSRNRGQEWDGINRIVAAVRDSGAEPCIIRGNHDNYLKNILARQNVEMKDSLKIGNTVFAHGHKEIKTPGGDAGLRVYGHEHPVVRIRDEIGAMITMPCFLYSEEYGFLIMPAFSPLASGTSVISPSESWMIPALRGLDMSDARVFTVSEEGIMDFGTVGAVRSLNFEG